MPSTNPPQSHLKVRRETFLPERMRDAARARLAKDLYEVHSKIFSGVSLEGFIAHVVEPPAEYTAIRVFRSGPDKLVGYCAFHRFARVIEGRRTIVLRAEAGLLPEYRGQAVAHWFGMLGALLEKLKHPFQRVVYLGTLVHPSSYRFFCKYFPSVYPSHGQNASSHRHTLAVALADSFQDPAVDPENPLVRDVGWITDQTLEHPAFISRSGRADIDYFEKVNPGYSSGHGLVVIVPVTMTSVGGAIARRFIEILHGYIGRRKVPL